MAQASYSNLNRRDGKYELGAAELFLSHCVWFRCFLGVAPLPFERASLAALTVDAGNSDLPSINEREGISSNRNPPAFSTRSLTADVMSFQFWNLVCSRTHRAFTLIFERYQNQCLCLASASSASSRASMRPSVVLLKDVVRW